MRMRVTVYDATNACDAESGQLISHPLEVLPRISVEVQPGWSVGDVLAASGHSPFNTFALVTPEMEPDFAGAGDDHMITGVYNLFGIDDRGGHRVPGRGSFDLGRVRPCHGSGAPSR